MNTSVTVPEDIDEYLKLPVSDRDKALVIFVAACDCRARLNANSVSIAELHRTLDLIRRVAFNIAGHPEPDMTWPVPPVWPDNLEPMS